MKHNNCKQTLIALDQFVFCFLGSILGLFNRNIHVYADLTLSAQAYRLEQRGTWYGKVMRVCIDTLFRIFEKDHCKLSYESELNRTQIPDEMK